MGEEAMTAEEEELFKGFKLVSSLLLQLTARFDVLKAALYELHPELESQLEPRIRKAQTDAVIEFATLQKIFELLNSKVPGPPN